MDKLIIAFITGLTTGGLSCLAVQGGLLTSSLANQVENDIQNPYSKGTDNGTKHKKGRTQFAPSILIFLLAKLVAYSALGLLLGLIGQTFQLSVYARAFLQIAIGIFMLGNALRMLNVHPIFRFFVFEPPAFLRRLLRKKANNKRDSSLATSAFLGFLTILIPCGVTQAMMAVALGTADPIQGAALMFAFTLGTSPVFFAVAYFTFQLGARLEKHFMRFVAAILIILAVITIDSGITLAGSPVSLTRLASSVFSNSEKTEATPSTLEEQVYGMDGENSDKKDSTEATDITKVNENVITINVKNDGYSPTVVHAKAGIPIQLQLVSTDVSSCARSFVIPSLGIQQLLDTTGEVFIEIPAQEKGTKIPFSCSMGMYSGTIIFDL